ncbi:MAG: CPBP family intramembrane metalloprotease [Gemmatimonadetes bacterium]|nr:CPBP family intramembrane metalloprotease [Gemmatimonadota bacterium]
MKRVLAAVLFVLIFNGVALAVLLLVPPVIGLAWGLALGAAFVWWHLRGDAGRSKRLALVRIRPPRSSGTWVSVAIGSTLLLGLGITAFVLETAPPTPPEVGPVWEAISAYQSSALGWLAIAVMAAGVLPLVEEFCFRGHVQHTLERHMWPGLAIVLTSVLFMFGHVGVPHWSILLISLTLGIANGAAVYLFDSIWVAVATHCIWNFSMLSAGILQGGAATAELQVSTAVVMATAALLTLLGLAGWIAILRAGRAGLRASEAPPDAERHRRG